MKELQKILSIMMILAMLLCAGCTSSRGDAQKGAEPPNNHVMVDLIGKSKDEVLTSLSLEETDLTEFSLGNYQTPLEITYVDVKLQVLLQFDPMEDVLNGVIYMAQYQGEPERAAKEMLAVAKEIQAALGTPSAGNTAPAWEMTESDIVAAITDRKSLAREHIWYMEQPANNQMEDYIGKLAETSLYKGYAEMGMKPGYQCRLQLSAYVEEGDDPAVASLMLTYNIGTVQTS